MSRLWQDLAGSWPAALFVRAGWRHQQFRQHVHGNARSGGLFGRNRGRSITVHIQHTNYMPTSGETVFDFRMGRGREGPKNFLKHWEGILQTDGYQAYDDVGGGKLVHVGCWAHARRKFVDAVKVNPKDGEAIKMVVCMDALFVVDRQARQQQIECGTTPGAATPTGLQLGRRDPPRMCVTVGPGVGQPLSVECADGAGAEYIITGNAKHFPEQFENIRIVTPKQFLETIRAELAQEEDD